MPSNICFFKSGVKFQLLERKSLTSWIKSTIRKEGYKCGLVNFIFCTDSFLLNLNRQYLKHNYFTDIITFDFSERDLIHGDVYISIDRVRDNASLFGLSFNEELNRVIIHGVLHLLGYKDSTLRQKKAMRRKEDACLSLLHSST